MTSLLTVAREKFLEAIRSVQPEPPLRWKTLVVDEHTQRILYNVLKRNDILEENVSTIFVTSDALYEPQPDQEAMYLLMPTTQNVERIVAEFSAGRRQFKRVHLFFLDSLAEDLFALLTQSPAIPFLACVTELYLNFWPVEAQAFSVEAPAMFFSMFAPPRGEQKIKAARERLMEELRLAARHIANICIALNEFPYIRYYTPGHHPPLGPLAPAKVALPPPPPEGSGRWRTNLARGAQAREYEHAENEYVARALAFMVQAALEEYEKNNPEFPKKERGRPRGTLIVTDRSMDIVAPFLHEFTYQAMANDLLPIEDGVRYTHVHENRAKREERSEMLLNDEDPVWVDVRHLHMRETIDKLMGDFNKFLKEHTSFRGEAAASMDAMRDMIATLPQYQEQMAKFSLHLSMAQKCMSIFEMQNLTTLATIEQNCATGLTPEGKTPKTLVEEMVPLLASKDVHNMNKIRIIALYIQYREGVPEEDRRRLCQHARLKLAEIDAINSLAHMGVRITRGPADKDIRKKVKSRSTADEEYDLSRYKPVLHAVLDDHVAGKLDAGVFPYVKDSPLPASQTTARATPPPQTTSLRSTRPTWHKAPRPGAAPAGQVRQRLMVFVAGGMTYSEMRTAYMRTAPLNRDIIIGSTHACTPEGFMDDLKVLEVEGVGSHAAPNGLREACGSFQRYFDERYFTQPPPPPRSVSAPAVEHRGGVGKLATAPRLVPSLSMSSVQSADSGAGDGSGKPKKKRGFFKF
ncbi:Sec1-like protein [Phellopilus nigrolimitatus]|nr:Sec1-like protein [Phellopilus nigrolimitatus]